VAGRGHPGGVELDETGGDVLDGLLGASLALGPVPAAEPVQARCLAADVAGDQLELVGGDEHPVAGLPRLLGAYSRIRYSRVAPWTVRCTIST
jgi:hypothetical protein